MFYLLALYVAVFFRHHRIPFMDGLLLKDAGTNESRKEGMRRKKRARWRERKKKKKIGRQKKGTNEIGKDWRRRERKQGCKNILYGLAPSHHHPNIKIFLFLFLDSLSSVFILSIFLIFFWRTCTTNAAAASLSTTTILSVTHSLTNSLSLRLLLSHALNIYNPIHHGFSH